ncbi:helix-turn-helix domain-containing protein [Rhodohalobacter mucosus]|uniref:AraC family transcriptional regulator n=1 Tax=Rhodohalobacter mucosus TaxID=2079485 RepID=A0A316TXM6_9BACT|nr:helix-turn-helix domain-containing protein [Rhodohalobacter mucosus]PWN07394.1 AraC family transcriptional regulator [Rhodohalobacter mucosus]
MNESSIAVLPFLNLSSDPDNEYFSDGVTEDVINALSGIKELKVSSRTSSFSFKNRQMDIRHIGNELGVATVLEGSIRKSGGRVRISAQLVRTDNGFQIWSGKFDRELKDIFALQDEISITIAEQIRENFGHFEINDHLIQAPTENIYAYNLYLKARYHHLKWDGAGIRTAVTLYEKCIKTAPEFSWPYFGLGFTYTMYGSWSGSPEMIDLAEQYLNKGFEIDSNSFLGYYGLATLHFWGRWDFKKGYDFYSKAIEANPSYTESEEGVAELCTAIGDFERAEHHAKNILQIDPLSPNHHFTIANIFYLQEDYEKALSSLLAAYRIDPHFTHAIEKIILCYIQLKRKTELESFLDKASKVDQPEAALLLYDLIHKSKSGSHVDSPANILRNGEGHVDLLPWNLILETQAGNHEEAMRILDDAVKAKRGQFMNFKSLPLLQPLHARKEFKVLTDSIFKKEKLPNVDDETETPLKIKNPLQLLSADEIAAASKKLHLLMKEDKAYLNASLSLRDVADTINLHPNKLSWLLNDHFYMNFNDYINSFRLEQFKEKATDPANGNYTLLGLAFESGFNSKSAFNDYFKKKTGLSPRKWLKSRL